MSEAVFEGHRTYRVRGVGVAAIVAVGLPAAAIAVVTVLVWVLSVVGDDDGQAIPLERGLEIVGWVYAGGQVPALVLTIVWLWRARRNLDSFPGTRPLFSAGWAIGGWFFPIANLFVPGRLMANVARESVREWWVTAASIVWWCCFLAHLVADRVATIAAQASVDRDEYATWSEYYRSFAVGQTVAGVAAVLSVIAFGIAVTRISAAQEERIHRGWYEEQVRVMGVTPVPGAPEPDGSATKIGRASCRERV